MLDTKMRKIKSFTLSIPALAFLIRKLSLGVDLPFLPILAYHRVFPFNPAKYPFDEGIISATPDVFDRQMAFISRNFTVLNFRSILDLKKKGNPLPRNGLIITFDDGYRDNYQFAFPVLRKYGITAVVFPTTAYVGSKEVFWFERVAYYVKRADDGPFHIESIGYHAFLRKHNRKAILTELLRCLKSVHNGVRIDAMKELDSLYGRRGILHRELVETLSWIEIMEMDRAGIEFGSHTCTHPVLTLMPTEDMEIELGESKKVLEHNIDRAVLSVSYPVGGKSAVNQAVEKAAEAAGYEFGVNYIQGINVGIDNKLSLNRVRIETDVSYSYFTTQLSFPAFFRR